MSFDRPVSRIVYGANPWPYARELMKHGYEVQESNLVPDDKLIVLDLDEIDRQLKATMTAVGEATRARLEKRFETDPVRLWVFSRSRLFLK